MNLPSSSPDRIGDILSWLIGTFPGITTPHLANLVGVDDGVIRVMLNRYRRRNRAFRSVPVYATLGRRGRRPKRWLPDVEMIVREFGHGKGEWRHTYLAPVIEQYVAPVSDWAASFFGAWMAHPATIGMHIRTHLFLNAPALIPPGVSSGYRHHVDGQCFLGLRPDASILDAWEPPPHGVLTVRPWSFLDRQTLTFPTSICWAVTIGTHPLVETPTHVTERLSRYLRWIAASDFVHRSSHRVWWLVLLSLNRALDIPSTYADIMRTIVQAGWMSVAERSPFRRIVGCSVLYRPYAWHVRQDWSAPAWHGWRDTRDPATWHTADACPLARVISSVTMMLMHESDDGLSS
jgi:hypothetical protein